MDAWLEQTRTITDDEKTVLENELKVKHEVLPCPYIVLLMLNLY